MVVINYASDNTAGKTGDSLNGVQGKRYIPQRLLTTTIILGARARVFLRHTKHTHTHTPVSYTHLYSILNVSLNKLQLYSNHWWFNNVL